MLEETIERLIALAKEEKWAEVDEALPKLRKDNEIRIWAYKKGLFEEDGNVRDLAASILEKADWFENQRLIHDLVYNTLRQEKHPYARFRMACALVAHGYKEPEVIEVLENAPDDVKPIALKYLVQK